MNSLTRWRFSGIIAITILGFLLHYLFSWTGGSKIIGLFVPVNESVWEHLKLGYWSVLVLSFVEYVQIKDRVNNYYFARVIGILSLEITILIIFYCYTFIAGKNIFLIDIFSYIIGVVICQYLTYIFFRLKPFSKLVNRIGLAAIIAIGVLFGVTTYYPPHIALFKDDNSKTFGINKEK